MTIGQVGIDVELAVPESGRWSGDTLSLSGTVGDRAATKTTALVLRDQFHGLAQRDGEVLPVTFGDTPELDGYYRIRRPQVSTVGASFESGIFDVSVELERVRSSAQVMQEMRLLGAGRTNAHSFTTVRRGWYSPGVSAFGVDDGTGSVNAPTRQYRSGSDGAMLVVVDNSAGTLFLSNIAAVARWFVAAGDHYKGGCTVSRAVGGTYYRVVGEQIPAGFSGSWAIGNTLLTVLGSTTAGKAEWSMVWHDGAGFESFKTFRITTDSSWTEFGYGPIGMRVVRNRADLAHVRVFYGSQGRAALFSLDVVVRRGARHAEFKWTTYGGELGTTGAWGVKLTSAEASTTFTSGLRATSADASGNKYWISSPVAGTADTTNGRLRATSSAATFSFGVGAELAGAGAGFDQFTDQVYQYMGALRTRQRAVAG